MRHGQLALPTPPSVLPIVEASPPKASTKAAVRLLMHSMPAASQTTLGYLCIRVISPKILKTSLIHLSLNMVLNMVLEELTAKWTSKGWGFRLELKDLISHLAFADDLILLAENPAVLAWMAADVSVALSGVGLELNLSKCEWTSTEPETCALHLHGRVIPYTPSREGILYLGSLLTLDGRSKVTLEHRVAAGWRAFFARSDVWKGRGSVIAKLKVFRMTVEPCVLFGCECWHLSKQDRIFLDGVLSRMVRKIMGRRRLCSPLGPETWLEWWRRTGRLAKTAWLDAGFPLWSVAYASRKWGWASKICALPDTNPIKIVTKWRDSEWQCDRTRSADLVLRRPRRGNPFRWDRAVHRFWARKGFYWLGDGVHRPTRSRPLASA